MTCGNESDYCTSFVNKLLLLLLLSLYYQIQNDKKKSSIKINTFKVIKKRLTRNVYQLDNAFFRF